VYELTIYYGGTAILTDESGNSVWTSDGDEDFLAEFDDTVSIEDADDIVEYLEDQEYLPDGVACEIVESNESGLGDAEDDDDELDDDDDEDELEE
jgi:hypothetical protein